MKMKVYSVYDKQVAVYGALFMFSSDIEAERHFESVCRRAQGNALVYHPDHFAMYQVGEFDDSLGVIAPINPRPVCEASKYIVVNDK